MRQSLTVVVERNARLSGSFRTEPYEAAWATEARWFVRTLRRGTPETRVRVVTQISPDGLHWCDLDHERDLGTESLASWPSERFGGWLRLRGRVVDGNQDGDATLMISLALKE